MICLAAAGKRAAQDVSNDERIVAHNLDDVEGSQDKWVDAIAHWDVVGVHNVARSTPSSMK